MCYDKSDSADNFPESCCVEVLNWKKSISNGAKFRAFIMTILPKKKSSSQSKSDRDGADRGVDSVQYSPRGLSQNQVRFFFLGQTHYVWFIMADICLLHLDFEIILKSDFWPFQIVLSQFRQSWAFEVRGMTFATFGCDLVLLPLPYLVRHK